MHVEELNDLVTSHDRDISNLALVVAHLTESVTATSRDVKKLLDGVTTQVVLGEKFDSLHDNLKESFDRIHTRVGKMEDAQNTYGCSALREANIVAKELAKDVAGLSGVVKDMQTEAKRSLPHWAIKMFFAVMITQSIAFGTYTVSAIHANDTAIAKVVTSNSNK